MDIDIKKINKNEVFELEKDMDFNLKPNLLENISLKRTCEFVITKSNVSGKIIFKCVAKKGVDLDLRVALSTEDESIREVEMLLEIYILNLDVENNIRVEPFLEIEQKGIKFEHKVAIGAPKEKWMKYLKSRGNDEKQVTELISQAFITG